ncbi:hypothetical protein ACHAWF_018392 [Thalassiosira exigua]
MIADRALHSLSYGTLSELELDGYCDFGFPAALHDAAALRLRGVGVEEEEEETTKELLVRPSPSRKRTRLDDAIDSFARVVDDDGGIDAAELVEATRAHLAMIRSGGSALALVAKDLEGNLAKVTELLATTTEPTASPRGERRGERRTLEDLLRLEQGRGVHDGNVLRDPSGAMGLLWIRRSLAFQAHLFESLASPDSVPPKDAARDAYDLHLSPYHGWMLRTVFAASVSQMPRRDAFLSKFGEVDADEELTEEREAEVAEKLRTWIGLLKPLLREWEGCFEELGLEDARRA